MSEPTKLQKTASLPSSELEQKQITREEDKHPEQNMDVSSNQSITSDEQNVNSHVSTLKLSEFDGDIFQAPPNAVLIHACNCEGSWGAGIALAFKKQYPGAYEIYREHCMAHSPEELFETALLIPPQTADGPKSHYVGCLFTSRSRGKKKDSAERILAATTPAMSNLMFHIRALNGKFAANDESGKKIGELLMCKINSGLFAVPWENTRAAVEAIEVEDQDLKEVAVISRPE